MQTAETLATRYEAAHVRSGHLEGRVFDREANLDLMDDPAA